MVVAKLIAFRSKFERRVYEAAVGGGYKLKYEPADAKLPYVLEGVYTPDFVLPNGIIVECKGVLDQDDRRKMAAVKRAHPELDIRFVFQKSENTLRRGAKMTYSGWAEKYGFPWAEGTIPEKWFNEKRKAQ